MRLIDADELLTAFPVDDESTLMKACVRMTIHRMPTVDAAPVVHGKWYKPSGMMPPEYAGAYRCSECDRFAMRDWKSHKQVLSDYCPWCGARMEDSDG